MTSSIYFHDNFFSKGITDIFNSEKEKIGSLDLKSAFSSSVDVLDADGKVVVRGKFPFFSGKWLVMDARERELGLLKQRFSLFKKRYEYATDRRGVFQIESEAFSREYVIMDARERVVAEFKKVNGFFQSPAFELVNQSDELGNEELIAVVMGVNMIMKRNAAAANSGANS